MRAVPFLCANACTFDWFFLLSPSFTENNMSANAAPDALLDRVDYASMDDADLRKLIHGRGLRKRNVLVLAKRPKLLTLAKESETRGYPRQQQLNPGGNPPVAGAGAGGQGASSMLAAGQVGASVVPPGGVNGPAPGGASNNPGVGPSSAIIGSANSVGVPGIPVVSGVAVLPTAPAGPATDVSVTLERINKRLTAMESGLIGVQTRQDARGPEIAFDERQRISTKFPLLSEHALADVRDRKASKQDLVFLNDYNKNMTVARKLESVRASIKAGVIDDSAEIDKALEPIVDEVAAQALNNYIRVVDGVGVANYMDSGPGALMQEAGLASRRKEALKFMKRMNEEGSDDEERRGPVKKATTFKPKCYHCGSESHRIQQCPEHKPASGGGSFGNRRGGRGRFTSSSASPAASGSGAAGVGAAGGSAAGHL
jgi:hypothetical protein